MKTTNLSNRERLEAAFSAALNAGKVHSLQDFSDFVGKNRSFVSSMMNGATPVSLKTIQQVESTLEEKGVQIVAPEGIVFSNSGTNNGEQKNFNPDPSDIVRTLTAEMAAQREQYAHQVERLLVMLEKEQASREELIKRL